MTILVAPDKFKGSLTAKEVCAAITEGIHSVNASIDIKSLPLADGGEGTCDLLTVFSDGSFENAKAFDPLFRTINCTYGISADRNTAFIEMARISGLQLLKKEERDPLKTSTYGTGQLIVHAIGQGASHIILGIGGSATNDAGIGMADALGFEFYSGTNERLKPVGKNLSHIARIERKEVYPALARTKFTVLCDVDNPLDGKNGAAYVFAPQKGADINAVKLLDSGLFNFKTIVENSFKTSVDFPGAGAAGGLGAGAKVFLNAQLSRGFDFIARFTALEEAVKTSDLVITGEGKIDQQSLSGKVVKGVAELAARYQKPCIAMVGKNDLKAEELSDITLTKIIALSDGDITDSQAIANAFSILKERAREFAANF